MTYLEYFEEMENVEQVTNTCIQLRKIGTDEVLDFYLDGDEPAYVDMPIWYTHNIKNIGDDVLYTNFWINEAYNPEDADTYFVEV